MTDAKRILRFLLVLALVGAALTALAARLTWLHLGLDEHVRARLEKGREYRVTLAASRGRILEGSPSANILAMSVGVKDVWVDPATITASGRVAEVSAALAARLGQDIDVLACLMNRTNRQFAYVERFVPDEVAEGILTQKLIGVHADPSSARQYQNGPFLCHVLGFANLDGIGSAGVEQGWDRYLRGCPGLVEGKRDGRRREVTDRRSQDVRPEDGNDVVLTVDQNIQHIVEKALDGAMEKNHAQAAFAIVERIRTGEILAMASRPGYDPNAFRAVQNAQEVMLNRAIGYVYEPGSTFKVAVIAGALDEGIVQRDTVFDCENGSWLYRNKVLRDYHPYGNLSVADILKKSSNIGAAKIALLMGDERLYRCLRAFHLGQSLGLDLPGEEAGILHPVERWSGISASRIAIGQGVAVTGLQMLGVLCSLANDGVLMRPYVVRRVQRADGSVVFEREPQVLGRTVTRETATLMRALLTRVTEPEGTGTRAAVEGFQVAGKTGTAQKPIGGVYSETDYMASFVGFLPADKPEIGIIVVVDNPQPLHTGGMVSAPVFGEIAEQTVRYLDIVPPSYAMTGP